MYTTQKQVRAAFWNEFHANPNISRKRIKYGSERSYNTDTRCAFVDYVDSLHRDGQISEALAHRVTL